MCLETMCLKASGWADIGIGLVSTGARRAVMLRMCSTTALPSSTCESAFRSKVEHNQELVKRAQKLSNHRTAHGEVRKQ